MTIRSLQILLATLAALSFGAAVRAETLADALAYGYENSGLLDQNRAVLRAADEGVAQAVATLLPVIGWSASAQVSGPTAPLQDTVTGSLSLSASLTLYDGGANRLAVETQKESVLATRQGLVSVEQQVLLRIVQAYMEVRRAAEFVTLRQNNVRLITQELRAANDRFEVGEITRTDVASAEARLALADSQLASDQGILIRAQAEFAAAVGRAPGALQPVSPAPIRQSVTDAVAIAVRSHPEVLQGQHQVSAAELTIARAEAALQPTVSVDGRLGFDDDFNESRAVGLSVSQQLYGGGRLTSAIREAMARRDSARGGLIVTVRAVEQNVRIAYASLEVSRATASALSEQVRAASVAFQGVREEAQLGARTTLDVLNAEQELLNARSNLISSQVDEVVASYAMLSAMGQLTAQNLNLAVQIYDPSAYYNLVQDAPTALSEQGRALDRVLQSIGGGN